MCLRSIRVLRLFSGMALATLPLGVATAATTFSVVYGIPGFEVTAEADRYYNEVTHLDNQQWDGISQMFHSVVLTSDSTYSLNSSLYGRYYDSDPTRPGEWGLLNRPLLTGFADPPWLVKHGLSPSIIGNPNYMNVIGGVAVDQPASYIAIKIGVDAKEFPDGVLFDSAALSITGFYNTDGDAQIWAATSKGGYTQAVVPKITYDAAQDTDVYTFDFGAMEVVGTDLEIHIFGILGEDQGTFGTMAVTGNMGPNPIPEPGVWGFAIGTGVAMLGRRKRSAR